MQCAIARSRELGRCERKTEVKVYLLQFEVSRFEVACMPHVNPIQRNLADHFKMRNFHRSTGNTTDWVDESFHHHLSPRAGLTIYLYGASCITWRYQCYSCSPQSRCDHF
jgi:hypothetical protein